MATVDTFHQRLRGRFGHLTRSQQHIVSYLLSHYDEAAFLPAADLARRLNISEATVVRCARAIGFNGYPELRRSLQDLFRSRAAPPAARLRRRLATLKDGHVLLKTVDMELKYLAEVPHSVQAESFDRAVRLILKARRVFTFGLGPARLLPELLDLRLRRFGFYTVCITESGRDMLEKLALLERGDVVVAAAFFRVTPELASLLDHAATQGAPVILITDTLELPLREHAHVILAARRGPISSFHSLVVPMTIINALILAVALARPKQTMASLNLLQRLRAASGLDTLE
ncbi:MAG: MurR/RpiR family transcriptional regulator [Armatimonadota bacterium]|nr:MurR/RpiR family transcriptional regulator [Armatimonadota bacterium]MDR7464307.1 MurR/RpiR family transcriptional regulator [Armatimonadota bacterium]MDR7468917.1 MurR/RpiR family transcriptional regulator [Armatimonadota bacterium]